MNRTQSRLILAMVAGAAVSTAAMGQTTIDPNYSAKLGAIHRVDADGALIWSLRVPWAEHAGFKTLADGNILTDNGRLISPMGHVLTRVHDKDDGRLPDNDRGGNDCPYWNELAEITPPPGSGVSDSHRPPLVDSAGNVWIVNTHIQSGDYSLQIRQSDGHTGAWQPMETISDTTNYVAGPEATIDQDDNITIVFRDISGGYHLYAIRYEPGSGWGDLTLVHTSTDFFQAIEVASDADGNVVAIFDPQPGFQNTVWSTYYDAQTETWSSPVQVSTPGCETLLPTLSKNKTGTVLELIYLVRSGGQVGLYGHHWDMAAKTWGPAELLPGSEDAGFIIAGPVSRLPLAVGEDGEASLLWQSVVEIEPEVWEFGVYASRTYGGLWQPACELLTRGPYSMDIENFAHMSTGDASDVIGIGSRFEGYGVNRLWTFHHGGDGWHDAENPFTSSLNFITRTRAVFYHESRIVASHYAPQGGSNQLTSMRHTGIGWLEDLFDIPGTYAVYFQDPVVDRSEVLLVFEAEAGGDNQGIKATWLRHTVGDLDCDGVVNVSDLLTLLGAWGACPEPPPDCPGDIDGNGTVDVSDLLALLGNWG